MIPMKIKYLCFIGLLLALASFQKLPSNDVIELPIKLIDGYGALPAGFVRLGEATNPDSPLHDAVNQNLTGIPRSWTNVCTQYILIEPNQFFFQSYKQQLINEDFFDKINNRQLLNSNSRPLSEKPIKCLVYTISGKDKSGILKYKVDVNNNFNFADDLEYLPPKIDWSKVDSLADKFSFQVEYESFRNGKIVELTAPLLIVDMDNGFFGVNIPLHAETEFKGTKILVSSQGFTTDDFDSVSVYKMDKVNERVNENESMIIGEHSYRNLGCDINKLVLRLEKLD
jgi:hypothetical protein